MSTTTTTTTCTTNPTSSSPTFSKYASQRVREQGAKAVSNYATLSRPAPELPPVKRMRKTAPRKRVPSPPPIAKVKKEKGRKKGSQDQAEVETAATIIFEIWKTTLAMQVLSDRFAAKK